MPVIEPVGGIVDGTNTIFTTSIPYVPGSLKVFLNGVVGLRVLVDGWSELGGRRFQLKEPPRVGDVVQAYYLPQ